jgi:hypothetical protein
MVLGYVTYGFGGMLEAEDRGLWLLLWSISLLLLPLSLIALCWVAMRRALFARNVGEAGGIAVVQVTTMSGLILAGISMTGRWLGWQLNTFSETLVLNVALAVILVFFAWRARRIFLAQLRQAAVNRYFDHSTQGTWLPIRTATLWWRRLFRLASQFSR